MSLYPLPKYVTVSTTNTWDTKYATVSDTWARKDTVTSHFTKYTLCTVDMVYTVDMWTWGMGYEGDEGDHCGKDRAAG